MPSPGIQPPIQRKWFRREVAGALLFVFTLLSACTEPPEIALTFEEQSQIDTLYSREVQTLRVELDSLCVETTAREMQGLIDSVVRSRREEESLMLQRIRENAE